MDFCRIFNGEPALNWGGEGREEGGESQIWKVKEDLEDLGVTCIWSLDTSAGLPSRHTSVFSLPSQIQILHCRTLSDHILALLFQGRLNKSRPWLRAQAFSVGRDRIKVQRGTRPNQR